MPAAAGLKPRRDDAGTITFPEELTAAGKTRPEFAALMKGQERLFRARGETETNEIRQLQRRRGQIANQIEGIAAQRASTDRQLRLIGEELADLKSLLDRA